MGDGPSHGGIPNLVANAPTRNQCSHFKRTAHQISAQTTCPRWIWPNQPMQLGAKRAIPCPIATFPMQWPITRPWTSAMEPR